MSRSSVSCGLQWSEWYVGAVVGLYGALGRDRSGYGVLGRRMGGNDVVCGRGDFVCPPQLDPRFSSGLYNGQSILN